MSTRTRSDGLRHGRRGCGRRLAALSLLLVVALTGLSIASAIDGQRLAIGAIHLYQRDLSPIAARMGARCRFTPTCSRYGEIVIASDGLIRGGWKLTKRIARCGPWTQEGTIDEP